MTPKPNQPLGTPQEVIDRLEAILENAEEALHRNSQRPEPCKCPDPECPGRSFGRLADLADLASKTEAVVRIPAPDPLTRAIGQFLAGVLPEEVQEAMAVQTNVERDAIPRQDEVVFGDTRLDRVYTLIGNGCNTIDLVCGLRSSKGRLYMVFVDDEGLLKESTREAVNPTASIICGRPLVGNVVLARDLEGEEYDPQAKAAAIDRRNEVLTNPDLN